MGDLRIVYARTCACFQIESVHKNYGNYEIIEIAKLRSENCVFTRWRDDVLSCVLLPLSNGVSGQSIDQLNKMQPHVHVQDKAAANPVAGLLSVKVPALGKKRGLPNWKVNHFFFTKWQRFLVWRSRFNYSRKLKTRSRYSAFTC